MSMLGGFDATNVDPRQDYSPIPAGKYLAAITESEEKPTKAGTGAYLALTFQILEGEFQGRKLWARLNLQNPNPKAVQIAQAELSAICRAVNVLKPQDSVELHDLPLMITVKCRKRAETDEITNEISGYAAKPPTTTPPPTGAAPWKRG